MLRIGSQLYTDPSSLFKPRGVLGMHIKGPVPVLVDISDGCLAYAQLEYKVRAKLDDPPLTITHHDAGNRLSRLHTLSVREKREGGASFQG